ncbi:response regulator [Bradyrhizobium sp. CB82]|uniref:response regulator transcription factor n=1 Tax=Bradyrhizobium sp. CB82 TaxID=3039159 RepID=UPI0024B1F8D8|nr:response regulator [Bradyrhizobium sp. CB82]WFU39832.1 response regulator [Bradyrhizobium sp. CB82]
MAHTLNIISVVCDDQSVREPLMDMLISAGCVAELFRSADEFLSSKGYISTSCLIADTQLPRANGLDLYEQLILSGNVIPTILLVTGPDDNRARALQAGVSHFLRKPFNNGELLACIKSALKDRTMIRGRP